MFFKLLDRWDERQAQRGEEVKKVTAVSLSPHLAFPWISKNCGLEEFCNQAKQAVGMPSFFRATFDSETNYERTGYFLKFRSEVLTDVEENNTVWAKITDSGLRQHAVVVFHHWNAKTRNSKLAKFLSKKGITVVEMAMPYHLERSRPGSEYADYMISADLGRTIQSVKQAVSDGQKLIQCLKQDGYDEISVLGMSLGSWVAGLVAAHDKNVSRASLFLTAGSLAEMIWTGRATRAIHDSLEGTVDLNGLSRAWAPLDLTNYVYSLARPDLKLQIILATRDKVVSPQLSTILLQSLKTAGAEPEVVNLNCGHYSLGVAPYILFAAWKLQSFFKEAEIMRFVP